MFSRSGRLYFKSIYFATHFLMAFLWNFIKNAPWHILYEIIKKEQQKLDLHSFATRFGIIIFPVLKKVKPKNHLSETGILVIGSRVDTLGTENAAQIPPRRQQLSHTRGSRQKERSVKKDRTEQEARKDKHRNQRRQKSRLPADCQASKGIHGHEEEIKKQLSRL